MDRETSLEIHALHARLCKAIADPKRLLIINELRDGPMTVGDLAESLQISQSNTSQHLAVLRQAGVVSTRRDGINVYYKLRSERISDACAITRQILLDRLQDQMAFMTDDHA